MKQKYDIEINIVIQQLITLLARKQSIILRSERNTKKGYTHTLLADLIPSDKSCVQEKLDG